MCMCVYTHTHTRDILAEHSRNQKFLQHNFDCERNMYKFRNLIGFCLDAHVNNEGTESLQILVVHVLYLFIAKISMIHQLYFLIVAKQM